MLKYNISVRQGLSPALRRCLFFGLSMKTQFHSIVTNKSKKNTYNTPKTTFELNLTSILVKPMTYRGHSDDQKGQADELKGKTDDL